MALIVEDGSVVAGANSYTSVADADTFMANRGYSDWASASTEDKEYALIKAADFIETTYSQSFKGSRVSADQPLSFPRSDIVLYGFDLAEDAIPESLIEAQTRLALKSLSGEQFIEDEGRTVTRERVDVIETYYATYGNKQTRYVEAERLLAPLLSGVNNGQSANLKLVRT